MIGKSRAPRPLVGQMNGRRLEQASRDSGMVKVSRPRQRDSGWGDRFAAAGDGEISEPVGLLAGPSGIGAPDRTPGTGGTEGRRW